jgi:holo-[acyl-carrier protein] synthase
MKQQNSIFPHMPHDEMAILGIGTDICNIHRIEKLYQRFKQNFLIRIFSPDECDAFACLPEIKQIPFLAKRFAAKEAIAKALHTGIGQYAYFTQISCLNQPHQPPMVTLSGQTHQTALMLAQKNNYAKYHIHVSLSDDTDYATAFVIITGITP